MTPAAEIRVFVLDTTGLTELLTLETWPREEAMALLAANDKPRRPQSRRGRERPGRGSKAA